MQLNIENFSVHVHNREEALELKQEIFTHHTYYFETDSPAPVIIDAGAHIGLATLYFKKLYPTANITAIEPNHTNFQLLERNILENRLENVTLVNAALAARPDRTLPFFSDQDKSWLSTSSFLKGAWNSQQKTTQSNVQTVSLSQFLTQPIDLLKMDIEGAEFQVLESAAPQLNQIKHILLEFHPHSGQKIERLLKLLNDRDFETTVTQKGKEIDAAKTSGLLIVEAVQNK